VNLRNKRAGRKEVEKLQQRATEMQAQAWYISRAGFTAGAIEYATAQGMYITDGDRLHRMWVMTQK
jgi:hypothetical protein